MSLTEYFLFQNYSMLTRYWTAEAWNFENFYFSRSKSGRNLCRTIGCINRNIWRTVYRRAIIYRL